MNRNMLNGFCTKTVQWSIGSAVALPLLSSGVPEAGSHTPNIVFILADDVSARELSTYDGSIPMPNLDRAAAQGVQFNTAWSAPLCSPTRAILMTGKYPQNQGYWHNGVEPKIPYFKDPRHLPLLKMAKQARYDIGWFGKIHNGEPANMPEIGVDEYLTYRYWKGYDGPDQGRGGPDRHGMYGVSWYWHPGLLDNGKGLPTTDADFGPDIELKYVCNFIKKERDRPFLVYWPSNLPHKAYDPEKKAWYYTDVPELDAQGNPTGGKTPGSLEATMHYFDYLIGKLEVRLKELGLAENTIIFFAGDNGTANVDKGQYDIDRAIRVPFVVWGGPVVATPRVNQLINFTDIWPTISDLTGYTGAPNTDGHSFAPLLLGKPWESRGYDLMAMNNARWIRTSKWMIDGLGFFYDVEGARSRDDYRDVTRSTDPEMMAARQRLQSCLEQNLSLPDYNDPLTEKAWKQFRQGGARDVKVYQPENE